MEDSWLNKKTLESRLSLQNSLMGLKGCSHLCDLGQVEQIADEGTAARTAVLILGPFVTLSSHSQLRHHHRRRRRRRRRRRSCLPRCPRQILVPAVRAEPFRQRCRDHGEALQYWGLQQVLSEVQCFNVNIQALLSCGEGSKWPSESKGINT